MNGSKNESVYAVSNESSSVGPGLISPLVGVLGRQ